MKESRESFFMRTGLVREASGGEIEYLWKVTMFQRRRDQRFGCETNLGESKLLLALKSRFRRRYFEIRAQLPSITMVHLLLREFRIRISARLTITHSSIMRIEPATPPDSTSYSTMTAAPTAAVDSTRQSENAFKQQAAPSDIGETMPPTPKSVTSIDTSSHLSPSLQQQARCRTHRSRDQQYCKSTQSLFPNPPRQQLIINRRLTM
jgi:hypothetical protein